MSAPAWAVVCASGPSACNPYSGECYNAGWQMAGVEQAWPWTCNVWPGRIQCGSINFPPKEECKDPNVKVNRGWTKNPANGGMCAGTIVISSDECTQNPLECWKSYAASNNKSDWTITPVSTASACDEFPSQTVAWSWMNTQSLEQTTVVYRDLIAGLKLELNSVPVGSGESSAFQAMLSSAQLQMSNTYRASLSAVDSVNYQVVPVVGLYAGPPVTVDATLTQAQADAVTSWTKKMHKMANAGRQANETLDNLSAAIKAATVNPVPENLTWVRRLARAADTAWTTWMAKGSIELGARPGLAVLGSSPLLNTCLNAGDVEDLIDTAVLQDSVYAGLLMRAQMNNSCGAGGTFPDDLISSSTTANAASFYAQYAAPAFADNVCTQTGWCSSLTQTTIVPTAQQVAGYIRQKITVTSGGLNAITDGTFVMVSIPGLPPVANLSLVAGTVKLVVPAPAGTYQVTVTFPEQKNAKLVMSSVTTTVVVQ